MFEQILINPERKSWTVAASLTFQCATVSALVLYSILHFEPLGPVLLREPLPPLPRLPKAVQVVAVERPAGGVTSGAVAAPNVFREPRGVPASVAMIDDAAVASAPTIGTGTFRDLGPGVLGAVQPIVAAVAAQSVREAPPTPRKAEAPRTVQIGGKVLEARMIRKVIPTYPPLARAMRISGTVELLGVIGRDGAVENLQVVSGHPLLVRAALDAVRQWTYHPTLLNGEAVEVKAPITVTFTLGN